MAQAKISDEWQIDCPELKNRATCLYQTRQWADCTFRFKDDSDAEGGVLKAHSLMLAMASPVFAAQFYGRVADRPEVVDVEDIKIDIFSLMLRYIYTDGIELTHVQTAMDLFYAAKKYFLHFLKKSCIDYLLQQLNPANVCKVYEFSCFYEEDGLKKNCLQMISNKTLELLQCSRFGEAKLETVEKIMSMESLNIKGEVDLLRALLNYARKCNLEASQHLFSLAASNSMSSSSSSFEKIPTPKKRRLETSKSETSGSSSGDKTSSASTSLVSMSKSYSDSSSSSSTSSESDTEDERRNKSKQTVAELKKRLDDLKTLCKKQKNQARETRKMLRNSVKKIRFLTMTPKQFAECRHLDYLLKKDEIIAISMNIASPDSHLELPRGFSKSTTARNKIYKVVAPGGIQFTIKNIWESKRYSSEVFAAAHIPWKVRVELCAKRKSIPDANSCYLRVHIDCLCALPGSWSCRAAYTIKAQSTTNSAVISLKGEHNFTDKMRTISHTRPWKMYSAAGGSLVKSILFEVSLAPQQPIFASSLPIGKPVVVIPAS